MTPSIAVIGGGISGSTLAWEVSQKLPGVRVCVFDQGRGLGGRMAHRSIRETDLTVVSHDASDYRFDHGCQFFRGDTEQFCQGPLKRWLAKGWAAPWKPKKVGGDGDFFGLVKKEESIYCPIGGMHAVATRQLLENADIEVCSGTRVGSVRRVDGSWLLEGTHGKSAYHDTIADKAPDVQELGSFDSVVCTDASSLQDSWHRAGAGLPQDFIDLASTLASTPRLALFTSLIMLDDDLGQDLEEDAFAWQSDPDIWFASRTSSKPGLEGVNPRCWTLVSTPQFAAGEIQRVPMRDPVTGAFRPQNIDYIRKGPATALRDAFQKRVGFSSAVVLGGQRWGSAFPAPDSDDTERAALNFLGTNYATARLRQGSLLPGAQQKKNSEAAVFIDGAKDGAPGIYFIGDFCFRGTGLPPGVEAAVLSALALAEHLQGEFTP